MPALVVRRYQAGLVNMRRMYFALADVGGIYDNSGYKGTLAAQRSPAACVVVHDAGLWTMIERLTE